MEGNRGYGQYLSHNCVSLSLILSWFQDQAQHNFTDNISVVEPNYRKASPCLSHTEPTQQDAGGTDIALLDARARAPAQPGLLSLPGQTEGLPALVLWLPVQLASLK